MGTLLASLRGPTNPWLGYLALAYALLSLAVGVRTMRGAAVPRPLAPRKLLHLREQLGAAGAVLWFAAYVAIPIAVGVMILRAG